MAVSSSKSSKIVVAHRGASGYLPEHTLAAKAMAYAMQPAYIEQDVVLSKDNVPIVVHDIHLETISDIAVKFPNRNRADGHYYAIDFTFDEIKTLYANERIDASTGKAVFEQRFPVGKSRFGLHSLQEEIELIQGLNKSTAQDIGIYPEIKAPAFHRQEGKDISKIVLEVLNNYGYTSKNDNCILQCFDAQELERIRHEYQSELFLVQLMESKEEIDQIAHFATYADGLGPAANLLMGGQLMKQARTHQLKVHAYTLRADQLPPLMSFEQVMKKVLLDWDVDGVFTDHPDLVKAFLQKE